MSDPISRTSYADAPLSSAKNPDARASTVADENVSEHDTLVGRTVSIERPRAEVYAFWRDFRNLPQFMENIESVVVSDDRRSHWVVAAPGGKSVEWDSVITEDMQNRRIAWTSAEGADVRNDGRIDFRDSSNGRGTIVTATIVYHPPGGGVGKAIAKLFQREPNIQARRDLRRFKQLMETGEVSTTEPQMAAPRG